MVLNSPCDLPSSSRPKLKPSCTALRVVPMEVSDASCSLSLLGTPQIIWASYPNRRFLIMGETVT